MGNRSLKAARGLLLLALLLAVPSGAQNGSTTVAKSGTQSPFSQMPSADGDNAPADPVWAEKQLRLLNESRQKAIVADTNKLLKLAQELDSEIAGANPDSLTPGQLRKIAEIEKLAHSVKEKMATPVGGTPMLQPERLPLMRW
jgi:hypothetical protein